MKKSLLLKWWLIFCFVSVSTIYSQISSNIIFKIQQADITYLSFLVIIIFYIYFILLGVRISKFCKFPNNELHRLNIIKIQKHGWFLSDVFMAVGFLGTLVGFMYMLDLSGIASIDAIKTTLETLTTGFQTALWTTIIALIASIILKSTLYLLGIEFEENDVCFKD